jgi:hypothetical protein
VGKDTGPEIDASGKEIIWNGTVQGLALTEQLHAAAIADCQALSVTATDYGTFHSIAPDIGGGITTVTVSHLLDN